MKHVLIALGVIMTTQDNNVNAAHVQIQNLSQIKTNVKNTEQ